MAMSYTASKRIFIQMLKRYSNIHDNDVYFLGNTLSSMQIYTHSCATRKKASGSIKYLYDLILSSKL